jgi:acyl-CoA thioester hydrolase
MRSSGPLPEPEGAPVGKGVASWYDETPAALRLFHELTLRRTCMTDDGNCNELVLRVRYADTDKMGVVYYANYLAYFEAGRTEYFRSMGHTYADLEAQGIFLVVVEAHCRYHASARYDEVITVRTWVSRVRRTRIDFRYEVRNESGRALVAGHTVLGCLNGAGKPRMLPDDVRETLERRRLSET